MTKNDQLFIQELQKVSQHNKENENKQAVVTSKSALSDELLSLFQVNKNAQGAWFFNVYVEFEPTFKQREAKEWQI